MTFKNYCDQYSLNKAWLGRQLEDQVSKQGVYQWYVNDWIPEDRIEEVNKHLFRKVSNPKKRK